MKTQLLKTNGRVIGEFPGFMRGIGHDGVYFYLGQSRNRGATSAALVSNNVSLDSGVIVFDAQSKVSRTLHLPSKIYEIHSVLSLGRREVIQSQS